MKKNTLYFSVTVIAVVGSIFIFAGVGSSTGNSINDEVQSFVISMKNYEYSPNVIRVEAGVPVELSLDSSVYGCFRDLMIPELRLRKYLRSSTDTLIFTPKKGTYTFACSMYMGQGKIIAE